MSGVVVGIPVPRETVIRHFVPFFAGDFAGFAAYAYGRIGEESDFDVLLHVIVPALIRALNSFANHCLRQSLALILFCPLCRDSAKIFRRTAPLAVAARDASSAVDRAAAHDARSNQEKPGHAANGRARCCR